MNVETILPVNEPVVQIVELLEDGGEDLGHLWPCV